MARQRKPFEFGLDVASYNPQGLRHYTEAELKKEYARVRREATERLRKLGQSEFKESKAYRENIGKFKPIKEVGSRRELERLLQEGARFVTAKSSSASGQREIRKNAIDTLHAHGYNWVNTKNYSKFVEFMEQARATGLDRLFYQREKGTPGRGEKRRAANDQREMFEQWQEANG